MNSDICRINKHQPLPHLCFTSCSPQLLHQFGSASRTTDINVEQDTIDFKMPRQTERVKAIMGKCVALQSTQKYAGQNSIFAEYCYDNDEYRDLLEPWFLQTMESFDTPAKRLKYAKECMLAMSSEDDNCLFIVSSLSFAQFSDYLDRCTSWHGKNKRKEDSLEMLTIEHAKSALQNLYRFSKYLMSPSMGVLLKQYLSGKKWDIVEKKKKISGDCTCIGKAKWISKFMKSFVSCS